MSLILNKLRVADSIMLPGTVNAVVATTANDRNLKIKGNSSSNIGIVGVGSDNAFGFQLHGDGSNSYGFLASEWGSWDFRKLITGALYMNNNDTYYLNTTATSYINNLNIAGSVGINTTTPQRKLDIFAGGNDTIAASFGHNVGAGYFSGFSFGYQESGNLSYRKSALVFERVDVPAQGSNASGKIHFLLRNDGTSSATSLTDSVMTIDSDAYGTRSSVRVGIGTRNPYDALEVNGAIVAKGDSKSSTSQGAGIHMYYNSTYGGSVAAADWGANPIYKDLSLISKNLQLTTTNSNGVPFTALYLETNTGNIGIGTSTNSPNAKLQVNGGITFGYGSDAAFYTGTAFDSSKYLILQNNTDSYGRIGLAINAKTFNGANTPSSNDGWAIDSPRSGIRFRAWLTGDTDYQTKFTIQHLLANAQNANGDLGIFARGYSTTNPAVVITGAGRLAVNRSDPAYALDVSGIARLTSSNDSQLILQSPDTWAGIGFTDGGGSDYIWFHGTNKTFAIGGGGANVSGKKLHVDGGVTIGSSSDSVVMPSEGLYVEGSAIVNSNITANSALYAPIFYDSADTGYYCNPNGASNFYDLNFGGKLAFRQLSTNTVYGPNIYWGITQPNGVKLYYDEEFEYSSNSIQVYNNNGGTAVTITRKNSSFLDGHTQVPNSTGYVLEIKHDPATSAGTTPYNGGWYFATSTGAGKAFLCVFKMKIPSGRNISFHSNSTGTNSAVSWITNLAGTGQYEDYAIIVNSGTGSWSSTFFFAIDGAATLFYTYLASATVYELTNVNDKVIGGNLGIGIASPNYRLRIDSGSDEYSIAWNRTSSKIWAIGADSNGTYFSNRTDTVLPIYIANAGSIGIGTTSPSTPLHIYKTGLADNSTNALLTIDGKFAGASVDANDIVGIAFRVENSSGGSQTTTSIGSSYQGSYNGLLLQPSGGNVGIGVKDPLAKLHILSSTPTSVTSVFTNSDIIIDSNTNSYINFRQTSDTGVYGGFVWTDNNHGAYIVFRNWQGSAATGGDSLIYGTYQDHIFQAGSSATINGRSEVMRILQNGQVGIGTSTPTTNVKLDVVGNIGIQSENSLRLYSSTNYSRIYASSITGLTIAGRFNGSMYNMVITAGSSSTGVLYALTDGTININPDGYDTLCSGLLKASSVQALNGSVSDQYGNLRTLPENAKTAAYTLAASDTGRLINITTGGITVPASVFSVGQVVTIYNNSASNQTITQGASVTMYLSGTATTGNRTLAQRGVATVICVASNTFVISGSGLT